MRRFSQRNSLVTLSDINITPLLDLAFVLLIIFIITTPLLEQGLDLTLKQGGRPDTVQRNDVCTVEISPTGVMMFQGKRMDVNQIEREIVKAYHANTNLVVFVRADENSQNKYLLDVLDRCQRNNIHRFSLRTAPPK
jgi:biopolymer transport protein ExbD